MLCTIVKDEHRTLINGVLKTWHCHPYMLSLLYRPTPIFHSPVLPQGLVTSKLSLYQIHINIYYKNSFHKRYQDTMASPLGRSILAAYAVYRKTKVNKT